MDRFRLAYVTALAVGAGTAIFFVWWWWSRKQKDRPPTKWRKVGELSDLMVFPVKSLGTIRENSMECTLLGLKSGWLRDRTLMVIDLEGRFVTARQKPKMVQGAYPDATSYMLINEASIADLNNRIEDPVTPQHFRPNFVVKGASVLEEDHWDWIKIGEVLFRNVKPCTRCTFTTINPETGEKHPKFEPLKTLRKYRLIEDPVIAEFTGDSPVMGIHLGLKGPNGVVRLGDPVYVGVPEMDAVPLPSPP